jgi:hypothetical protein
MIMNAMRAKNLNQNKRMSKRKVLLLRHFGKCPRLFEMDFND